MTAHVRLRRADANDAERIAAWRAEPSVARFQPIRQYDVATLRHMLAARRELVLDPGMDGKTQWIVLDDGQPAGWVSLDVTSREHATGSIGYTIAEQHRGKGLAKAAVRQVVALAFDPEILALERLEANVAVENTASQRVLEGAGFRREGIARGLLRIRGRRIDHYRYGLLRRTDLDLAGHRTD
ncbi:MAG: GNAT family N-acetyltransferase [Thermomicrobiales bacterium]